MSGIDKVLNKLRNNVQEGNYYEAHQMYHSVSQRFIKQNKIVQATALLLDGAKQMVTFDQLGSAVDLTERLIDLFESQKLGLTSTTRGQLLEIYQNFPLKSEFCDNFVQLVINWSSKYSSHLGDPILHHLIACRYFKEGLYYEAESHFILGGVESGTLLGLMEWDWSLQKQHEDIGYYVTRGVLGLLNLGKSVEARACLTSFLKKVSKEIPDCIVEQVESIPLTTFELLNFSITLLEVIEKNKIEHFTPLVNQFQTQLSYDTYLEECLKNIAALYFRIGVKVVQPNPFADMLKNMLGGPQSKPSQLQIADDMDMD
ncbi:hypothetical protein BC833DRAFT_571716 [Globomyces pollinis-pini]|nr:hypothetical protein BC833DRAFT_571716 [Globomyces pollinis-pini]